MADNTVPVSYRQGKLRAGGLGNLATLEDGGVGEIPIMGTNGPEWGTPDSILANLKLTTEGATVLYPEDRTYPIISNVPYAGIITATYSKSFAGTATATFKKNGTSLGGTANSVSITEQSQSHNVSFAVGDDLSVTLSSTSSDGEMFELNMIITKSLT